MSSIGGSELFSNYQQDFQTLHQSIQHKIDQQIPQLYGGITHPEPIEAVFMNCPLKL